jgi:hypothetical protein
MAAALQSWGPLALSLVALLLAAIALVVALRARRLAQPSPEMVQLADELSRLPASELLALLLSRYQAHEGRLQALEEAAGDLTQRLRSTVQRIGLTRFNSEEGLGGNLSFALVMLDGRKHGFCITSLYSLTTGRLFVRGIINGKTDLPLNPEEQEALNQALQS